MRVAIVSLGCRVNQAECSEFERDLLGAGHETADSDEEADLCILNTCAVTARAERQSRQEIRRLLRRNNRLVVTGCFAHLNHEAVRMMHPGITVLRNDEKQEIARFWTTDKNPCPHATINIGRSRPILKVQDGCNRRCSYCIVPIARGRSKSIGPDKIIEEIRRCHAQGKNEVVLSGVHLGSYGHDLDPPSDLARLLEEILHFTKIRRIRLSSLEVNEITDHLIEMLKENRLCCHLHIPLQSGDNDLLMKMQRPYTLGSYIAIVNSLYSFFPRISIGTDVIAGFPGEGEREFLNTYDLIESLPFSYVHVFPYSPRKGTAAYMYRPVVPESEKRLRVSLLRSLGETKRNRYIAMNMGVVVGVVLESFRDGVFRGISENYLRVSMRAVDGLHKDMLVDARLTGHSEGQLWAVPAA